MRKYIKDFFENRQENLIWMTGESGRGYYSRYWGSSNFKLIARNKEELEEHVIMELEEIERIEKELAE